MSATSVNMIIETPDGCQKTRNVPFINPNAADSGVTLFLATLNNRLTDNELLKLEKVAKSDLDIPNID